MDLTYLQIDNIRIELEDSQLASAGELLDIREISSHIWSQKYLMLSVSREKKAYLILYRVQLLSYMVVVHLIFLFL